MFWKSSTVSPLYSFTGESGIYLSGHSSPGVPSTSFPDSSATCKGVKLGEKQRHGSMVLQTRDLYKHINKHIRQTLLLHVHSTQLIEILSVFCMKLQQLSVSTMGSKKQLKFPFQVFHLAKELFRVFKNVAGHFPTQSYSNLFLSCSRKSHLSDKWLSNQGQSPKFSWIHPCPQKAWLCLLAQGGRKAVKTSGALISNELVKATLHNPNCAISAPKIRR